MTTGYIYRPKDVRPLLQGLMAHVSRLWAWNRSVHAHRCTACEHPVACWCATKGKLSLVRCAWCTPWVMEWRRPETKASRRKITKKKPVRRKVTRRLSRAVP